MLKIILRINCFELRLNGCYEHLDGGSLNEALQDFTGGVCETFSLKQSNYLIQFQSI